MDILDIREYCLSFPDAVETTPFDETTLVYKVRGKMFLLTDMEDGRWINVKCDPDRAIELRERYEEVTPGWHMNKRHWIGILLNGTLRDEDILSLIAQSYELTLQKSGARRSKGAKR